MIKKVMVSLGSILAKLRISVDIPSPDEVKALLGAAQRHWRPTLMTAVFTGLRASELRGLTWADVDFGRARIHVRQCADRYSMGRPKSEAGDRDAPRPGPLVSVLREWRLVCPKKDAGMKDDTVSQLRCSSSCFQWRPCAILFAMDSREIKGKHRNCRCLSATQEWHMHVANRRLQIT